MKINICYGLYKDVINERADTRLQEGGIFPKTIRNINYLIHRDKHKGRGLPNMVVIYTRYMVVNELPPSKRIHAHIINTDVIWEANPRPTI